jgi:hypothetical protein
VNENHFDFLSFNAFMKVTVNEFARAITKVNLI